MHYCLLLHIHYLPSHATGLSIKKECESVLSLELSLQLAGYGLESSSKIKIQSFAC